MKPQNWTWGEMGWPAPQTVPHQMPDNVQKPETLLVDRHGKPLITRERRSLGFRPPETKR